MKNMISNSLILFLGVVAGVVHASPLTLVEDGKPTASLVIAADQPSRAAQMAAFEIQHHVKLMTGATLPIVKDSAPITGVKILLGDSAATHALGIKHEDFSGEEYMVKNPPAAPDTIVLIGNDTPGGVVNYQDRATFPFSNHYATLNNSTLWAAYDFLEKGCDIRWYAPSDIGTTFTPRSTLAVEMNDVRRKPAMDAFRYFYSDALRYEPGKKFSDRDDALLKLRWRQTERFGTCNHNVFSLYFKYYKQARNSPYKEAFVESHPEYFAQGFSGRGLEFNTVPLKSNEYPGDVDLPPQPCLTNRAVIEHFAQEAVTAYDGKFAIGAGVQSRTLANTPYFYPIELDDNLAVCQCANCQKIVSGKPVIEQASYIKWYWVNEIAKRTAQINPQVGIVSLAYNTTLAPPEGMSLSPNLMVQQVLHPPTWWHPLGYKTEHDQAYRQWVRESQQSGRPLTLWFHFLAPGGDAKNFYRYDDFFPGFYASKTAALFKEFAADGIRGFFAETHNELGYSFWYDQVGMYIAMRLADDPALNSDKLIAEFFDRYYGAAGRPMREFYQLCENTFWNPSSYPLEAQKIQLASNGLFQFGYSEEICWGSLGTKERMQKLAELMAQAKQQVQTPAEKQRLAWFDAGLWQSMLRGRANYESREKFRSRPVSELTVPKIPSLGGDITKVDWSKAANAGWATINGFPVSSGRTLQLAHDGQFLYIKYSETGDATKLQTDKTDLWHGDILEFFAAAGTEPPYNHFAINPAGKTFSMGHYYENGIRFEGPWTSEVKLENRVTTQGWTTTAAFPLAKLLPGRDLKDGGEFRANFFRGMPEQLAQAWSPIFSSNFHTLDRMGKLKLAQ